MPLPGWWLKSLCICHSSLRDRDQMVIYVFYVFCYSPGSSHDSPAISSLTDWAHLCISLLVYSRGWYRHELGFCSTVVPIAGVGVVPVPIILPSHPEAIFVLKGNVQYWMWLSRSGQSHSMFPWDFSLELLEWQHSFSRYLTSLFRFLLRAEVPKSTRGDHYPRHLPMLSHTPCYLPLCSLWVDPWVALCCFN